MSAAAVRVHRLFFALWPDAVTRAALIRATRALVRHCGGRPVPPRDFHLTLAFLGTVPDERFDAVRAAAAGCRLEPLTLLLDRLGYFPAPRVLWLGPSAPPVSLARFVAALATALAAVGQPPDPRPFHPHLTLARKVASAPAEQQPRPVEWPVTGFSLVESQTLAAGARYRVVADFPAGEGRG
ncbi:MAG: RNA 2',3'-cyclic phosphodiesterase [Nevskiales bacterium]